MDRQSDTDMDGFTLRALIPLTDELSVEDELQLLCGVWEHCTDLPMFTLKDLAHGIKLGLVHTWWTLLVAELVVYIKKN